MRTKRDEVLSRALLAGSPEESVKILIDAGMFVSMRCHGYIARDRRLTPTSASQTVVGEMTIKKPTAAQK